MPIEEHRSFIKPEIQEMLDPSPLLNYILMQVWKKCCRLYYQITTYKQAV